MAHFAELDDNNIVIRVLVIADEYETDGENYCANLFGGRWKQTSYNNNIRGQYAGVGFTYDAELDIFIAPQPYPSWLLDSNYDWIAPVPCPSEGLWIWDEDAGDWVEAPDGY